MICTGTRSKFTLIGYMTSIWKREKRIYCWHSSRQNTGKRIFYVFWCESDILVFWRLVFGLADGGQTVHFTVGRTAFWAISRCCRHPPDRPEPSRSWLTAHRAPAAVVLIVCLAPRVRCSTLAVARSGRYEGDAIVAHLAGTLSGAQWRGSRKQGRQVQPCTPSAT